MRYYMAAKVVPSGKVTVAIVGEDGRHTVIGDGCKSNSSLRPFSDFFGEDLTDISLYAWDPSEVHAALDLCWPGYLRPKYVPLFISSLEQTWRDLGRPKLAAQPIDFSDTLRRAQWAAQIHRDIELTIDAVQAPLFAQALRRRINRAAERAEDKTREQCVLIVADHIYKVLDSGASVSRTDVNAIAEKIIRSTLPD